MPFADVNGQRIAYDDTGGDGPAVVLAHGFLMDRSMFEHQVDALAHTYRVVTWDERCFGDTVWDGQPFTYWDSARDCLGLMDHLGVRVAVVGGMSQGGFLSLRAALLAPERVRAVILLNSGGAAETPEATAANEGLLAALYEHGWVDDLARAVAGLIINDPGLNEVWIERWRSRDREPLRAAADCLSGREDLTDRLGEITCPVLVVHGAEDAAIEPHVAELTAKHLPRATGPVWIDGAAHAANMTHPEPVNAAIVAFLAELSR
jgi:pimeloyl-ACP methyl ester carboxylesterase